MRKPSLKKLQAECDKFNAECPVGSRVVVTKDCGGWRIEEGKVGELCS